VIVWLLRGGITGVADHKPDHERGDVGGT